MTDFWNSTSVNPDDMPAEVGLSESVLAEHLGHMSQFVGLMDNEEKVRAHLDEVAKFQAVRANLLSAEGYVPHVPQHTLEPEPEYEPETDHVVTRQQYNDFLAGEWGSPEMDAALAADQAKLEGLGAFEPSPGKIQQSGLYGKFSGEYRDSLLYQDPEQVRKHYEGEFDPLAFANQRASPLPSKVIVQSNPSGPGHEWVQARQPYDADQHREALYPQPDAPPTQGPTPDEVELARLEWKGAIAKRNELMHQWDTYIAQCRDRYRMLKSK